MKRVIYLILFVVFVSACGKYPEGPKLSLKSRQSRIEGLWKIHKFYVNGVDSTVSFTEKFGNNLDINESTWEFPDNSAGKYNLSGKWNWYMFKYYTVFTPDSLTIDNVSFSDSLVVMPAPFVLAKDIKWEIKRIFTSELFLETVYDKNVYRLELTLESDS